MYHVSFVCVCTYLCVHMYVWMSEAKIGYLLKHPLSFFLRQSLTDPRPPQFVHTNSQQGSWVLLSLPPSTEMIGWVAVPGFYVGAGDLNSGPHCLHDSSFTY